MDAKVQIAQLEKLGAFEKFLLRCLKRRQMRRILRTIPRNQVARAHALADRAQFIQLRITGFEALQQICGEIYELKFTQGEFENCPKSAIRRIVSDRAESNDQFFRNRLIGSLLSYKVDVSNLSARMHRAATKALQLKRREIFDPSIWIERTWKVDATCIALDDWNILRSEPRVAEALSAVTKAGGLECAKLADGSLEWLRKARDWAQPNHVIGHPMAQEDRKFVTATIDDAFMRLVPGYAEARERQGTDRQIDEWELYYSQFLALEKPIGFAAQYEVLTTRHLDECDSRRLRRHIAWIDEQDPGLVREFIVAKMLHEWDNISAMEPRELAGKRFTDKLAGNARQREDLIAVFDEIGGDAGTLAEMLEIFSAQGYRYVSPMTDKTAEVVDKDLDSAASGRVNDLIKFAYHFPNY